jgi:hypothetical protein
MASKAVTEFDKIGKWFQSIFKKLPAWNVVALSALNVAAPLIETVVDLADPAAGAILTSVLTTIQAKFGTVASLLGSANVTNLSTTLESIVSDLPQLLSVANISNPESAAKATSAITDIESELQAILAAIPAAA